MDKSKTSVIMERYCPVVDTNVVIMKNLVKNDGSYRCISHTDCAGREECRAFLMESNKKTDSAS